MSETMAAESQDPGTLRPASRYRKGEVIGDRYRVEDVVESGGFAAVYLTVDTRSGQPRALRTLKRDRSQDPATRRLAAAEVSTWIGLGSHPNVVRCFELVHYGGDNFLVLEWVRHEGYRQSDLAYIMARRESPLPANEALRIVFDVLNALAWLTQMFEGAVHADVKPGNIVVADDGSAKLGDFGISLTKPRGMLPVGSTPRYASPEQARGEELDPRSDLYSLGLVAFEMLMGRRFEEGKDSVSDARLPEGVPEFLARCLKPRRADRFASAQDAMAFLARVYLQAYGQTLRPAKEHTVEPPEVLMLATTFMQVGRAEEAVRLLQYLRRTHDTPQVAYELGDALARLGRLEEAERELTAAISAAPTPETRGAATHLRADVYMMQGRLALAEADYLAALKEYSDDAHAHWGLAEIAFQRLDLDVAKEHLEVANELDPAEANTLISLARLWARLGDKSKAEALIRSARDATPDLTPSQSLVMALAQSQELGDKHAARATVDDALERFGPDLDDAMLPQYGATLYQLLRVSLLLSYELGDYEAVVEASSLLLSGVASKGSELYWRGSALLKLGHVDDAEADFRQALRLDPDDVLAALKLHHIVDLRAIGRSTRCQQPSEWTLYFGELNWGFSFHEALRMLGGEAFTDALDGLACVGKPLPFERLDRCVFRYVDRS